jgi:hypothetical protein
VSFQGLTAGVPIVDATGAPTPQFLVYMQQVTTGITNSSGASMPTPATVSVLADYTGSYLTGQLPRTIVVQRFLNGADVSAKSRWFLSTVSGSITASIDQTGVITVTTLGSSSVLQAKSVRDGVTLTCNVIVNRVVGSVPSTGGSGGSTVSVSSFSSINSASYAPITTEMSVTVGSSGTVALNAPLDVSTSQTAPAGNFPVFGKWQWWDGTTWQDVAAEIETSPDPIVVNEPPLYEVDDGTLTVNMSKTGLTVGSTQKFRLSARMNVATRTMVFSGTASVIP